MEKFMKIIVTVIVNLIVIAITTNISQESYQFLQEMVTKNIIPITFANTIINTLFTLFEKK